MKIRNTFYTGNNVTNFIGRDEEIQYLIDWYSNEPNTKITFLVGQVGTGKTALVLHFKEIAKHLFSNVIYMQGRALNSLHIKEVNEMLQKNIANSSKTLLIIDGLDEINSNDKIETVFRHLSVKNNMHLLITTRPAVLGSRSWLNSDTIYNIISLGDLKMDSIVKYLSDKIETDNFNKIIYQIEKNNIDLKNPRLLNYFVHQFNENKDVDLTIQRMENTLSKGYNGLLVTVDKDKLKVYPTSRVGAELLSLQPSISIPVGPYIIRNCLSSFWRLQLNEFEELINETNKKEADYQRYFEKYPHFIKGVDYEKVVPHPILDRIDKEGALIPDYFLQLLGEKYADILELKLPNINIISGKGNRIGYSAHIHSAIAQVREYRDYFEKQEYRASILQKYGLTAYRPTISLVIGRKPKGINDEKLIQINDTIPPYVKVITYDKLFEKMKRLAMQKYL